MDVTVVDLAGKTIDTLVLDDTRWEGPVNLRLLSQVVRMYRANKRAGTASTKKRGDVSGGGKKPWKQKHTGRARAGSIRSPLWRHGGIVFGPHPRNFGYQLPKAIKRRALRESLKGKLLDEEVVVINQITASEPSIKPFRQLAKTFGVDRRSIIVLDDFEENVVKSLRNLAAFRLCRADELNAFDVLSAQKVLLTKRALERVINRLNGEAQPGPEAPAAITPRKRAAPQTV